MRCQRCDHPIGATDVHVSTDVGSCRRCGEVVVPSALRARAAAATLARDVPDGAWLTLHPDGFEAGARTTSWAALVLVPFAVAWTLGVVAALHAGMQLDAVFAAFALLAVCVSALVWVAALMAAGGRCVLSVRGEEAVLFSGVGRFGRRRRFPWPTMRAVSDTTFSAVPTLRADGVGPDEPDRGRRLPWAALMKRTWGLAVLVCPRCAGPMRLISVIEDERVAAKILAYLGLPARAPPRGRPWRAGQQQLALRTDADRFDGIDTPSFD